MDLVALNIQRGRDHGLPPYVGMWAGTQMDQLPGGMQNPPDGFDSLRATTTPEVKAFYNSQERVITRKRSPLTFQIIAYLKSIYKNVNDIDLYIGGVTERHMPGALLGPTFAKIIYRQFDNLKHADRFFYDDLSQPGSLTPGN